MSTQMHITAYSYARITGRRELLSNQLMNREDKKIGRAMDSFFGP